MKFLLALLLTLLLITPVLAEGCVWGHLWSSEGTTCYSGITLRNSMDSRIMDAEIYTCTNGQWHSSWEYKLSKEMDRNLCGGGVVFLE